MPGNYSQYIERMTNSYTRTTKSLIPYYAIQLTAGHPRPRILDVGFGSGVVGSALRSLLPDAVIYVRIADHGCGIADIAQAMTPLYSSAPAEERAGLGFTVMQSFTDRLTVTSKPGRGTTVTMRKKLTHDADKDTGSCS